MRIERFRADRVSAGAKGSARPPDSSFGDLVDAEDAQPAMPMPPASPVLASAVLPSIAPAPAVQDREARRHGGAVLRALGGLQLVALGGDRQGALRTLSDLAAGFPKAADPGLDQILRAIAQRAAVELARAR